jgi:hypothetical protein
VGRLKQEASLVAMLTAWGHKHRHNGSTYQQRTYCKPQKRMAPQVGLESPRKRHFNNMERNGRHKKAVVVHTGQRSRQVIGRWTGGKASRCSRGLAPAPKAVNNNISLTSLAFLCVTVHGFRRCLSAVGPKLDSSFYPNGITPGPEALAELS